MAQVSYGTITITDTNDIESIIVEYNRNQSTTTPPAENDSGWSTTRPTWAQGYYIWQRTRIHKTGTQDSADTFGTAVCLTGSTGQTGATGKGITGVETLYATNNSTTTAPTSGWQSQPPTYNSSKPKYWVKVTTTYNSGDPTVVTYLDNGITDAMATAAAANQTANNAKNKVDSLETTYNTFINTEAKYFVHNSSGSIVIASREGESSPVTFDKNTVSTYGYNALTAPSYIALRYNSVELAKLSTGALTFYKPNTTNKGMELTSTALTFYNPSNNNAQLIIGANGILQSGNYIAPTITENDIEGTSPYSVTGSKFDLTYGSIITPNFVVDNENGNAYLNGMIETVSGHIGGFVITDSSIYHNKRDISSVDLSDDVFIISSDPYVLDQEDYLYGGYATLYEVYMGVDGISCGFGKFAVDSTGELFASNATIKGNITATSGSFGLTNGYYEISNDGLVGYRIGTVYYFKMIEILANDEYDEGSVEVTSLSLETSSQSYSYTDILAIDTVTGVGLKKEDDKLFIILKTNSTTPISEIFDGTITSISCSYTYKQSGEELGGFGNIQSYTGLTTPSTETDDYISGTELGYDYLKTDKLIASDGLVIIDENNQNAISISSSSVIVGNSLDDSKHSYIYIDSNDFIVFDNSHTEAFLVSSDGALLVNKKRLSKQLNVSSYSASLNSPTTQTITVDCVARNLPTESNYDAKITFEITGKHINDDSFAFWETGLEVNVEDIKNAGSSGLDFHTSYYDDGWRIVFVYNNQSQTISVTTNITSEGQKWFKQIFATLRTYSYVETTESMTPYFSMGSRKENTTLGAYSISGGYDIEASGNYSQAFGCGTIAQGAFQTVIGKYNLPVGTNDSVSNSVTNTDFAFMIGNGTSDNARTNAFAVDWNGTAHLRSIRSIRHSYAGPCSDGDAYEEILVGNMTYRAQKNGEPIDIPAWIRCTIIALCQDYPGKVQGIFKGRIVPNSAAYFEICIYDTGTVNSTGMPQYAYGVYRQWPNHYWDIWIDNYVFNYSVLQR